MSIPPYGQRAVSCPNRNHARLDAPVRHCPQCGGVVNDAVSVKRCPDTVHATYRRQQNRFCIDCGLELIAAMR